MKHLYSLIVTLFFLNSAISAQTTAKASSNSPVCEGNTLKLSAEGGTSYDWKGPDSFNSKEQNPVINNATAKKSGTYTVVVNGVSTILVVVKVGKMVIDYHYAYSGVSYSPDKGNYLYFGTYTNLSSNSHTYSWEGPNSFTSNLQYPTILKYDKKNQGIYTATLTDEFGCTSKATTEIKFKTPDCPYQLGITYSTQENFSNYRYASYYDNAPAENIYVCKSSNLFLKIDTLGIGSAKLQWYKDNKEISGATNSVLIPREEGLYYANVVAKGCEYISRKIQVNHVLAITPSIFKYNLENPQNNTITICKGSVIDLRSNVSDIFALNASYQWFKDDKAIDRANTDYLSSVAAGEYRVVAQVDNCAGSSKTIKVVESPTLSAKIFFTKAPETKEIKICDSFTGNMEIKTQSEGVLKISLNGNPYSTDDYNRTFYTNQAGTYVLVATQGNCKSSDTLKITSGKKQDLLIANERYVNSCQANNNSYYYPINSLSAGTYTWQRNNSNFSTGQYVYPSQTGNYQLKYTNPQTGCTGESAIIKVDKPYDRQMFKLQSTANSKTVKICKNSSFQVSINNCYSGSVWKKDGITIPNTDPCYLKIKDAGKFWYEYNNGSCAYYSDTLTVEAEELPTVSIVDSCLKDNSVALKVTNSTITSFQWYQDGKAIIGANATTFNVSGNNGTYYAQVSKNGCLANSNPVLVGVIIINNALVCRGDTIKLTSQGSGLKSYLWSGPNNFSSKQQNITIPNAKTSGIYSITATTNSGCTFSNRAVATVNDYPAFTIDKNLVACEGQEYYITTIKSKKLTDTTETIGYINWRGPNQFTSGFTNPIIAKISSASTGIYTATVFANKGCKVVATTSLSIDKSGNCKSITVGNFGVQAYCQSTSVDVPFISTGFAVGTKFKVISTNSGIVLGEGTKSPITIKIPDYNYQTSDYIYIISDDKTRSVDKYYIISGFDKPYIYPPNSNNNIAEGCSEVQLSSYSYNSSSSYQWLLDGKEIANTINKSYITAVKAGKYSIKSIGINSCINETNALQVTLGKMPKPFISGQREILCGQDFISITTNSGSDFTYKWSRDGIIQASNADGNLLKVEKVGKYLVEISKDKCSANSDTITITKSNTNRLSVNIRSQYYYDEQQQGKELINNKAIIDCSNPVAPLYYYAENANYDYFKTWKLQFYKDGVETSFKTYTTDGSNIYVKEPGIYSIKASTGNCVGISNEIKVEKRDYKKAFLYVNPSTSICEGTSTYISKSTNMGSTYDFETGKYNNVKKRDGIKMYRDGKLIDGKSKINFDENLEYYYASDRGDYTTISTPFKGKYHTVETVTYDDNSECTAISDTIEIKVVKQIQLTDTYSFDKTINVIPINSCRDTVTIYGQNYSNSNNRPVAFTWKKDGVITKDSTEILKTAQAGTYQLETRYKGGCSALSQAYKVEFGKIKLSMNISEGIACEGVKPNIEMYLTNILGINDTSKVVYQWKKDAKNILLANNTYLIADEIGKYTFTAKQGKCEGTSSEINIKSDKLPTNISPIDSAKFCEGASTPLSLSTEAGLTYQWENDGSSIKNAINSSYGAASEGTYQALLRRGTCWDYSKKVKVTANILPKSISISDTLICPNLTSTLKVIPDKKAGTQSISYAWEKDNKASILANIAEVKAQEKGLYRVLFKRENCSSFSNVVKLNHKDIPTAVSPLDTSFCANGTIELKGQNVTNTVYQWEKDGNPIVSAVTSNLKIGEIGKYRVLVKKDGCEVYSKVANVAQKPATTALITGNKSINYADSSKVSIAFTSDAPWTFKLSDGKEYVTTKSPFELSVKPQFTTTYNLSEVKNICGIGTVSGTAKVEVIILSTEEEKELDVEVFPVPSSEVCNWKIQTPQPTIASIVLYDVLGVTQHSQTSTTRKQTHEGTIDLTNLKVGTYYLKLQVGDKSVTRKVVKY